MTGVLATKRGTTDPSDRVSVTERPGRGSDSFSAAQLRVIDELVAGASPVYADLTLAI
jgi:hypothetical protein